jgi:hypothetical protein
MTAWKVLLLGVAGLAFVLPLLVVSLRSGDDGRSAAGGRGSATGDAAAESSPQLALVAAAARESSSAYYRVEGQVKNVSGRPLRNVEAVVTWYDGDSRFVTADSALIEYNPILADQTSPFRVLTRSNPALRNYSVAFKELGGAGLRVTDERDRPERPPFQLLARSGTTVAVLVTAPRLKDDNVLWRIARNLQKDEAEVGHDGSVTVMLWIDRRFAPTSLPASAEQMAQCKATISIDRKANKDRLIRHDQRERAR